MNSLTAVIDGRTSLGLSLEVWNFFGPKKATQVPSWYGDLLTTYNKDEWPNYWLALLDLIAEVDEETMEAMCTAWQVGDL